MSPQTIRETALGSIRANPGRSLYWVVHELAGATGLCKLTINDALGVPEFTREVERQGEMVYAKS